MNSFISMLQNRYALLYRVFLFLLTSLILLIIFPKEAKFKYDYHQAKPWNHQDLIAPFDFAMIKSDSLIKHEQEEVLHNFKPYFIRDEQIGQNRLTAFKNNFYQQCILQGYQKAPKSNQTTLDKLESLLAALFETGIIAENQEIYHKPSDFILILSKPDKTAEEHFLHETPTLTEAQGLLKSAILADKHLDTVYIDFVASFLTPNILPDVEKNQTERLALKNRVSTTYGLIQKGEKIISRGEVVTREKFNIIDSLRQQYEKKNTLSSKAFMLALGQFILILMSLVVFALFLYSFRRDIYYHNKKLVLLLMLIVLAIGVTRLVAENFTEYLYMVPICIVPLIVRVFFDTRLALFVHLITIILIGFLVPNSFEFLFLQLIAGIITIISIVNLYRRSQFFITGMLIFIAYNLTHLGIVLIEDASFEKIVLSDIIMFAVSAFTIILAYPLIYAFERIFGFVTNISLLELADTNNALLRQLSAAAPGTFQHSLQVANLAEDAVYKIGGNPLLVRVGALYHDIGKMEMPQYYIENMGNSLNPHDELSPLESAGILLQHVIQGIEIAKKNKLPDQIIDFIRTHHGTKKTEYFYHMYRQEFPAEAIDESKFTYRGPLPVTIETCVLMMADSIEAASRSKRLMSEDKISDMVDQVVSKQLDTNQFIQADISFKDINQIKKSFKQTLLSIHHIRSHTKNN